MNTFTLPILICYELSYPLPLVIQYWYDFNFWTLIAVFGMNVGGVPWTGQNAPELKDGFRNVILLCVAMLFLVLLCFIFPALYTRIAASWRNKRAMGRSWSLNRKSLLRRSLRIGEQERGGYLRIWWFMALPISFYQRTFKSIITSFCFEECLTCKLFYQLLFNGSHAHKKRNKLAISGQ